MLKIRDRYHPLSIWLHWLVFLLFIAVIGAIELRSFIPLGTPFRSTLFSIHIYCGQLVFILTVLRLAARIVYGAPEPGGDNKFLILIAKTVHALLYLLLGSMLFTGAAGMMAGEREVFFLGLEVPPLIAPDEDLQFTLRQWHGWAGKSVIGLVGLHTTAAIWHHFFLKDGLLQRMNPHRRH